MDKRGLQIAEGERERGRVTTDLGTNGDHGKSTRGVDVHVVVHRQAERGNKKGWVVIKVLEPRDETEKVLAYEVVLGNPDFLAMFVEDVELVGVLVFVMGAGRGLEEMGEECSIDQIHGQSWGDCEYARG